MRENAGEIECFYCHQEAPVRVSKTGRLYVACSRCGNINAWGDGAQERIREKATLYGAGGKPAGDDKKTEKKPAPPAEDPATPPAEDKPKKRGIFADVDL